MEGAGRIAEEKQIHDIPQHPAYAVAQGKRWPCVCVSIIRHRYIDFNALTIRIAAFSMVNIASYVRFAEAAIAVFSGCAN